MEREAWKLAADMVSARRAALEERNLYTVC